MSKETGKRIVDTLDTRFAYRINFIGGEPLLNFDVMEYITEELLKRVKVSEISLITNGTIYNRRIASYIEKHKDVLRLDISCDGIKSMHDRERVFAGTDRGSYDIVWTNLQKYLKIFPRLILEMRYRGDDAHEVIEGVRKAVDCGIRSIKLAPVDYCEHDPVKQSRIFDDVLDYYIEDVVLKGIYVQMSTFHMYEREEDWCKLCGAGFSLHCYDERGDVYPCYSFAAVRNELIGHDCVIDRKKQKLFRYKLYKYSQKNKQGLLRRCYAEHIMAKHKQMPPQTDKRVVEIDGRYERKILAAIEGKEDRVHPKLLKDIMLSVEEHGLL
jgi:sulfatase maturation enzyme AslB (radical SAM superfamily)